MYINAVMQLLCIVLSSERSAMYVWDSIGKRRVPGEVQFFLELYVNGDNAEYFAYVTRKSEGQRMLLKIILVGINFISLGCVSIRLLLLQQNSLKEIKMIFGAGGFLCSLSDKELAEFHHFLEKVFPFQEPNRVKHAIICAVRQPEGVWVLNRHLIIDGNGVQIPEASTMFAWPPIGGPMH